MTVVIDSSIGQKIINSSEGDALTATVASEKANSLETISALRVVYSDGGDFRLAHGNAADELDAVVGILNAAVVAGSEGEAITHGEMEDSSWSWSEGDCIFVQDDGSLGSTPGTHIKQVAVAWSATKIYIDIEQTWRVE